MDYIEIKGYKSIKDARVELQPINILIGANGSGKTNFLSFFEFLNAMYETRLDEYIARKGSFEKMLHKGSKVTQAINLKLGFGDNAYEVEIKRGDSNFYFINSETTYFRNEVILGKDNNQYLGKETKLRFNPEYKVEDIKQYLSSVRKYHFQDTGPTSPFGIESNIRNDVYSLYENGKNIAAFLFMLRERNPKTFRRIVQIVQSVAPYFFEFYLHPNGVDSIALQWRDKLSSTIYGVNDLSDGTLRFIALTVLFMQPDLPSAIIIDEPELGLHPFAIAKLAGMIQSAASRDCQIIVATQSADLISHFKPEDVITVDQINGETQFKRLESNELAIWLDNHTIDDLWKRSIIETGQPN